MSITLPNSYQNADIRTADVTQTMLDLYNVVAQINAAMNLNPTSTIITGTFSVTGGRSTFSPSTQLTGTTQYGVVVTPTFTSAATVGGNALYSSASTVAGSYTQTSTRGFYVDDAIKGAGSTITNLFGIQVADQTQGSTLNVAYSGVVTSGSGKWNVYMSGSASNAFAGNVRIGSTVAPTATLDVTGSIATTGGVASTNTNTVALSADSTQIQIGVRNSSTGTAAQTRVDWGNNASAAAFTIGLYGGNHATKPSYAEILNQANAPLILGANGNAIVTLSGAGVTTIAGLVDISGAAAGQIKFPSTQDASADANTLDDYREGAFTATATGMTTSPTGSVKYVKIGNSISMYIPTISGTSNATTFTLTGMPAILFPLAERPFFVLTIDNGGSATTAEATITTGGLITLYKDVTSAAFTNSGTKSVLATSLQYII